VAFRSTAFQVKTNEYLSNGCSGVHLPLG